MEMKGCLIFAFSSLLLLIGCTETIRVNEGLISRLRDRGPVALSSENPYLAANLLVSRELERSAELKGFIEHRGAPNAIELEQPTLRPLLMHFYYPEEREMYTLEEVDRTWVIRGPLTIPREKMKQVATLTRDISGQPSLSDSEIKPGPFVSYNDKAKDFYGEKPSATEVGKPIDTLSRGAHTPPLQQQSQEQVISDTIASLRAEQRGEAEVTPKGDLVHYVTYPGETLSMISRWYTDDRANAGKIARINNLAKPNELEIGDMIVIPSYLVRNKIRMGEEVVKKLAIVAKP